MSRVPKHQQIVIMKIAPASQHYARSGDLSIHCTDFSIYFLSACLKSFPSTELSTIQDSDNQRYADKTEQEETG